MREIFHRDLHRRNKGLQKDRLRAWLAICNDHPQAKFHKDYQTSGQQLHPLEGDGYGNQLWADPLRTDGRGPERIRIGGGNRRE